MRPIVFIVLTLCISLLTGRLLAGDQPAAEEEFTKMKSEYTDVLPLRAPRKARFWPSLEFFVRNPGSPSIRRRRVANIASTAAWARWFTLPRNRKARLKTLFTNSTLPASSRQAWIRRDCNSYPNEAE